MKYVCKVCGYIFDEAKEGKAFNDLDDDFKCPLCGAPKDAFEKELVIDKQVIKDDDELVKLNVGEMSALCSNLSRGCEKQYLNEEAKLFLELAKYFDNIRPKEESNTVDDLIESINYDLKQYQGLKDYCIKNDDRGAARVSVWGEKVTRMLSSLVDRYLKEGEKLLENTNIWVCSVCGFVYIGDEAPNLCPICKVPSWKFEKMEGIRQ